MRGVCVCVLTHALCFSVIYHRVTPQKLDPSNEGEGKNNDRPSVGPRPELLHFPKSATPLHVWSTKVGSWKYCLLVKSPTMDRPLKRQTGLEIYCHMPIYLPKVCKSLESSSNKAYPCRGQPRATQPARHMLVPSRNLAGIPGVGLCKTLTVDLSHGNSLKLTHRLFLLRSIYNCLWETSLVDEY